MGSVSTSERREPAVVEQLYTEFHSRLLARCTAMCHDSAMAEDLVQKPFCGP